MSKNLKKGNNLREEIIFSITDYDNKLKLNGDGNSFNENLWFELRFFVLSVSVLLATFSNIHKNVGFIF